jgi:MFS family permease
MLASASMTGMSLLVPMVTWLILTRGWRSAYMLVAIGVLVILLPVSLWVIRESPESMGLGMDGGTPEPAASGAAAKRVTAMEAMQTLRVLAARRVVLHVRVLDEPAVRARGADADGPRLHADVRLLGARDPRRLQHRRHDDPGGRSPIASAAARSSPRSMPGRILIFSGFFLIRDNPIAIVAVAILGGITMSGTGSMTSALTADIWGRFSVSRVLGVIFLVHQTGSAIGSWLAGALFEATGGYGAAFILACLFLFGAAIVALRVDTGKRRLWRTASAPATS